MSVSAAITVNQILTRVAAETGLPHDPDPFGSSREEYNQLRALLQTACEDLCLANDWEFLTRPFTILTTDTDPASYPLPDDFSHFIPDTEWNHSTDEPIFPLSAQQWRAIKASDINPINWAYRIMGGKIELIPFPVSPDNDLRFEYSSRYFAIRHLLTDEPTDTIESGSDTILFDRTLISRYLKYLWLSAKGFDSTEAASAFNQIFGFLVGKDDAATTLNAGRRGRGFRMLNMRNAPDQGYGQ